jgi:hypothetical protein
LNRVVVALTTLLAASLGASCTTGPGVGRVDATPSTAASSSPATATSTPTSIPAWTVPADAPRYKPATPVLGSATPVRLEIPSIGVSASLVPLGLAPDGSMEVPKRWEDAGWYSRGPRPGEDGPAVIAGHVDSESGPAVFFRLRELRAGDVVRVIRADRSVARFVIDRLQQFPKRSFPTAAVFAPTPGPVLRLITCTGAFDQSRRSYLDNLVAFASPVA